MSSGRNVRVIQRVSAVVYGNRRTACCWANQVVVGVNELLNFISSEGSKAYVGGADLVELGVSG